MTGTPDGELSIVRELAATFSKKELAANREEHDRYPFGPFFTEVLNKAHDAGLLTIEPEGAGREIPTLSVVVGEISQRDASLAGIIVSSFLARRIIIEAGSGGLVETPRLSKEAYAGSLIAHASFENPLDTPPALVARKEDRAFLLSGEARYVVLGGIAPRALVAARTGGGEGFSYFLVDTYQDDKRVAVSGPVLSMGLHACPAVDMTLKDAPARLVGKEGGGTASFQRAADLVSIPIAAMAAGIMKGSLDEALAYARERFQGGRPIIEWSEVRMILARMALATRVAELAVASASEELQEGSPGWEDSARAAAIFAAQAAADVTTDYMTDYGQEKRFRDARQIEALLGILPMRKLSFLDGIIGRGPSGRSAEHE
jgi:alkylation response protein AidB-like acyl-CoA dehydrogenase